MLEATLTSKGQTTIPKELREAMDLKAGTRLTFTLLSDGTVLMRAKDRPLESLRGMLKTKRRMSVEQLSR